MNILEVKNLVKEYKTKTGTFRAVDGISFQVKKGEIFGLLGINGAGKSTTINMLTGLLRPTSGTISMFGKDFLKNEEECKQRFNVATAYYNLSQNLTIKQNLKVYALLYNVKNADTKIKELCSQFSLQHLFNTKLVLLSSGERTRVVLVKALLSDPELLFLDECTVGLDPDMAEITRDMIAKYHKKTNCTIIFTSHYMQEVEKLCDRVAFVDQGKIVKMGRPKDLIAELKVQRISLTISKNQKALRAFLKKEGISFEEKGDLFIFSVENRTNIIYPLFEKFIERNLVFEDLVLEKPTLEEYFLSRSRK
ncbi:ABC transporter ATP-binding protein [Candidatus Woesearchaeota archaeon]|nr:ABC transporter ATP-binding protein [Candidatus Woesearchaeota archaeon]